MPYAGMDWGNIDANSEIPLTFDFSLSALASDGDPIASVVWSLKVDPDFYYTGTDATPSARLSTSNSPTNDHTTATIWIGPGCVAGVRYRLSAVVTLNSGVIDDLWNFIRCDPDPTT